MLAEWQAFGTIEPFGEERMDQRFRIMTAWIVSALNIGGVVIDPEDIRFSEPVSEPIEEPMEAYAEPTQQDVLRDQQEQAQFR